VQLDGEPYIVLEVRSSGAGGPAEAKLRNLLSEKIVYKTWKKGTTLEYLASESRPATYLFFDQSESCFVFYDDESFEEIRVGKENLGDTARWLTEGIEVDLNLFDGRVIELGFRGDVILEVVDIVDYYKKEGKDRKNARTKRAGNSVLPIMVLLSNGDTVQGPKYLKKGDRVVVDPETSSILKRL